MLALIAVITSCGNSVADQSVNAHKDLLVPPNAQDVRVPGAGDEVSFVVPEPYAATAFRVRLDNAYAPPTWKKVDELTMFPGSKTSDFPGGWRQYSEAGNSVRMLPLNWRRSDGTVVTYVIRYRWPFSQTTGVGGHAEVQAALTKG
jgi:hypothetical protein